MAYSKVERHMWNDDRFRRFTRDQRDMWQYLLTTEHSNRLGLFVLDPLYAAADLSASDDRWTETRVLAAWGALAEAGRIAFDSDARLVLLLNHLKHNQPENPNVVKGALSDLAALPFSASLWPIFLAVLRQHVPAETEKKEPFGKLWAEAVEARITLQGKGIGNRFPNGFGNGMPNPEPEPEPEPLEETEAKASEPAALRDEPATDMAEPADQPDPSQGDAEFRALIAPLVRKHLWGGRNPPGKRVGGKPITMDREITVARQLAVKYSIEELVGAIESAREVMGDKLHGEGLSLLYFNTADRQQYFHLAVAHWRNLQIDSAAAGVDHLIAGMGEGVRDAA